MYYDIKVEQDTGLMYAIIKDDNGGIVTLDTQSFDKREDVIAWIVEKLRKHNPEGPCYMTRKKVYNTRAVDKPGFWELTTYNSRGVKLRTAQYRDIMPEGYLRGLVQDQIRFPLEAAEEIE